MKSPFWVYVCTCAFYIFISCVRIAATKNQNTTSDIFPEEYTLLVVPFLNNFMYWGKVSIKFSILSPTNQIMLNAKDLKPEHVILKSLGSEHSLVTSVELQENNGSWSIFTFEELAGRYTLNVSFTGNISNIKVGTGLLHNVYIDNEIEKVYLATQSRVGEACRLFPCFNNTLTQAPFIVHIARFLNQSSNSNTDLQETSLPDYSLEGRVWDRFHKTPNISTHQVGFILHELSNFANQNFTVLATSEAVDQANLTLSLLPVVAHKLQEWFPGQLLRKLDVVALPDSNPEISFYPGLVFCREDQVLFKKGVSNSKSQEAVIQSVVNILVRQFLSTVMIVQPELTEGLVSFLEHKLLLQLYPSWEINNKELYMYFLQEEALDEWFGDSAKIFHKKVATALKMAEDLITEKIVMQALSQIINERRQLTSKYMFSTMEQLAKVYNKSSDFPTNWSLTSILQVWTSQPGYPVISVNINDSGISIIQKCSLQNNATWPILLNFKSDKEIETNNTKPRQIWLTNSSCMISFKDFHKWILFGIDQSGYFRVNYKMKDWHNLSEQLIKHHSLIPAVSRSQLINDIFYLAEQELVNYTEVFYLSHYLAEERDYFVWKIVTANFENLIRLFYGTQLASDLQEYVKGLYTPYFEDGYRQALNNSHTQRFPISDILYWACHWQLNSCIQFTSALFKQWLSVSPGFPVDFKPTALCTGVREFPHVFLEVFDSFTQSLVESDRRVFLTALACTNDSSHIDFLLKLVFLDQTQAIIGYHSKLYLIEQLIKHSENILTIITFLEQNYYAAVTVVGPVLINSLWAKLGRNIHTQEEILLVQKIAESTFLPLRLREGLNSTLMVAGIFQRLARKLVPLVSTALPQNMPPSCSICAHSSQCVTLLLGITLLFVNKFVPA